MNKIPLLSVALILSYSFALIGCGTGSSGGGKDPLQAALVSIDADPAAIKVGDRTLVTIEMQNIDENGVFLKVRFSNDLSYIEDTPNIHIAGESTGIDPVEGPFVKENWTYMTFYIPKATFGEEDYGSITFQLRAMDVEDEGTVQVDVDLHDPNKDPAAEFNSDEPLFGIEDSAEVEINRQ